MAKTLAYPNFVANTDPDQAYIDAAKPKVLEHMMYGGARLAALMVDIYGKSKETNGGCYAVGEDCSAIERTSVDPCCPANPCQSDKKCGPNAFEIPDFFLH